MRTGHARRRYALWLRPDDEARRRLARTVRQLSREYSAPAFQPHVTLVSGILGAEQAVVAKAGKLAQQLRPLRVRLTRLEGRREYFRCVFARAGKSAPLVEAHRSAKQIFRLGRQRPFLPHLSLVYGDLPPRVKKEIIRALGQRVALQFTAWRLDLVRIQGGPSEWKTVRSWKLRKP